MATLYDKDGKEYKVAFAVDVKEWIASGKYFKDNPKAKKPKSNEAKEGE